MEEDLWKTDQSLFQLWKIDANEYFSFDSIFFNSTMKFVEKLIGKCWFDLNFFLVFFFWKNDDKLFKYR